MKQRNRNVKGVGVILGAVGETNLDQDGFFRYCYFPLRGISMGRSIRLNVWSGAHYIRRNGCNILFNNCILLLMEK